MRMCIGICVLWLTLLAVANAGCDDYKIFCYYTDWSAYRPGSGEFQISNINKTLCTHLIYSFTGITGEGNISVLDPWQDLPDDGGKNGFGRFTALDDDGTDITLMVSLGGWGAASTNFTIVANNATLRTTFTKNVVDFLIKYGFEGIDLDWEYPAQRGGVASDVQNFILLLEEIHDAFRPYGFLLTVAVGAEDSIVAESYNVSGMANAVDYINLMTYEYHSGPQNFTGHNAPLYAAKRETAASDRVLNINASVHNWISLGAPASKIVLGTPAYGKTFTLEDTSLHVPGSPVSGAGTAGPISQGAGVLLYYEICPLNWTVVYDEEQRVPYAYSGDQWVTFDNTRSMREKTNFVKSKGLAGAMIWAIDEDDFRGICGDEYPLVTTLYNELCL